MAVRLKARSATPGAVRLAAGVMDALLAAADVRSGTDRGDGTLGTFSGSPVDVPTLAIADSGDGTGAVATVAGSTTGTTNTIYVATWPGSTFTSAGSRTANGTVSLSLATGIYWGYCRSSLSGLVVNSLLSRFVVTDATSAVLSRVLSAVRDVVVGLALTGVASTSIAIRKQGWLWGITEPGVVIAPRPEAIQGGAAGSPDVEYAIDVVYARTGNRDQSTGLAATIDAREAIRRAFTPTATNRPIIDTVPDAYSVRVTPGPVLDSGAFAAMLDVSALTVRVICREAGGIG
jgi:hypothetical protein